MKLCKLFIKKDNNSWTLEIGTHEIRIILINNIFKKDKCNSWKLFYRLKDPKKKGEEKKKRMRILSFAEMKLFHLWCICTASTSPKKTNLQQRSCKKQESDRGTMDSSTPYSLSSALSCLSIHLLPENGQTQQEYDNCSWTTISICSGAVCRLKEMK